MIYFFNFKNLLFTQHFDLFGYYLNSCISKQIINDEQYCLINPIFIYPFDIEELLDRKPRQLSGGQRRKADIARALFHSPSLLILDDTDHATTVKIDTANMHVDTISPATHLHALSILSLYSVAFSVLTDFGKTISSEYTKTFVLDNNFYSIANAILYGRTIFKSIRKFIIFQLTVNLCAVSLSIIGS